MLKKQLELILKDYKAVPKSPTASAMNDHRISLLEEYLKEVTTEEVSYAAFLESMKKKGENPEESFGRTFYTTAPHSAIVVLFRAFRMGVTYVPALRRLSTAIEAKATPALGKVPSPPTLMEMLQYRLQKITKYKQLVKIKGIEKKKNTNAIIWEKIVDELDEAQKLLKQHKSVYLGEYLDSEDNLRLGALSRGFFQLQTADPSIWRDKLVAAGCEAKFVDPIIKAGVLTQLPVLYHHVMRVPAPYDMYLKKKTYNNMDAEATYNSKEWQLCCLSGKPQAIQWAYNRLPTYDYKKWFDHAVILAAFSGNVAGMRLVIKLNELLREKIAERTAQSKAKREERAAELLKISEAFRKEHDLPFKIHEEIPENKLEEQGSLAETQKNGNDSQAITVLEMAVMSGRKRAVLFCTRELQLDPKLRPDLGKKMMQTALKYCGLRMIDFLLSEYQLSLASIGREALNTKPIQEIKEVPGLPAIYFALQHNTAGTVRRLVGLPKPQQSGEAEEKGLEFKTLDDQVSQLNPGLKKALGINALFYAFEGQKPENIRIAIKDLGLKVRDLLDLRVNPLLKALRSDDLLYVKFVVEECGVPVSSLIRSGVNVLSECYYSIRYGSSASDDVLRYIIPQLSPFDFTKQIKVIRRMEDQCTDHRRIVGVIEELYAAIPDEPKTPILSFTPLDFQPAPHSSLAVNTDSNDEEVELTVTQSPQHVVAPETLTRVYERKWW